MATYLRDTISVPVFSNANAQISLDTLLRQAYGELASEINSVRVSYFDTSLLTTPSPALSYWDLTNRQMAEVSMMGMNFADTPVDASHTWSNNNNNTTTVRKQDFGNIDIELGTNIKQSVFIDIQTGSMPNGEPIWRRMMVSQTPDVTQSLAAYDGVATPDEVVRNAKLIDSNYNGLANANDCHAIASAIASASGATLDYMTWSNTRPVDNEEGGFWRIAYRGSDPNPVANWETLVRPGDIVRMNYQNGNPHTVTVTEGMNAAGQIRVVDNTFNNGQIGEHWADFDSRTNPQSITIYRLSDDHKYLINGSQYDDVLLGSSFGDEIRGGNGVDILKGGNGEDILRGYDGNDKLYGGSGSDTLDGNAGADHMEGGSEDDLYYVEQAGDVVVEQAGGGARDHVVSYINTTLADNVEYLTLAGAHAIEGIGNDLGNRIVASESGSGSYANWLIGKAGNDEIHGGGGADTLFGGFRTRAEANGFDGNDVLYGEEGDDFIIVQEGNDVVHGGRDIDTLAFTDVRTDLTLNLESGSAAYYEGGSYTTPDGRGVSMWTGNYTVTWDGIENLVGGSGKDTITGDGTRNVLMGAYGDDTLNGGAENDILYGGYKESLAVDDGKDTLNGGDGDDLLVVRWGNDEVHGGADNDTLSFVDVTGSLKLDLGAGRTTFDDYSTYVSPDGKSSGASYAIYNVTWDGVENLIAGKGGDTLTGDSNNNRLDGGLGTDVATFHGDHSDYVITRLRNGNLSVRDTIAGRDGTDVVVNVETLKFADGATYDVASRKWLETRISGTTGSDTLNGTNAAEVIDGSDGRDWLTGNGGGDTLLGGAGDDTMVVDSATKKVDGGAGWDVVIADASTEAAGLRFNVLGTNVEHVAGRNGNDTVDARGVATAVTMSLDGGHDTGFGGDGDDTLWGGAGNDTLSGGNGFDQMLGGDGDDVMDGGAAGIYGDRLFGDAGNDTITVSANGWGIGGVGNDTIRGGAGSWLNGEDGDDVIIGEAGMQQIVGGAGNDTLTGGADYDRFDVGNGWGHDRITDFQAALDRIDMTQVSGLDSFSQLTVRTVAGGTEVGFAGNSIVLSGVAASVLTPEHFLL
jgi:Ca2+-binding RTX toxin-like protein